MKKGTKWRSSCCLVFSVTFTRTPSKYATPTAPEAEAEEFLPGENEWLEGLFSQ